MVENQNRPKCHVYIHPQSKGRGALAPGWGSAHPLDGIKPRQREKEIGAALMARFVLNVKVILSAFRPPNFSRRGYAVMAPKADRLRGIKEQGSEEKSNSDDTQWWMPDPITGCFVPENHHRAETPRHAAQPREDVVADRPGYDHAEGNKNKKSD